MWLPRAPPLAHFFQNKLLNCFQNTKQNTKYFSKNDLFIYLFILNDGFVATSAANLSSYGHQITGHHSGDIF